MTMENLPASERQVLEDAPQEPSHTKSINLLSDNVQEPQYVMEVSSNDGHLPSAVIRINSSSSLSSDVQICRICHEFANEDEDLFSPCKCSGTLGTVHRSCLEQWLAASNTSRCELCQFEFALERMARPLNEWLRDPALHHERRTLFGDFICFLFITPLAGLSGWLCVQGAVDHLYFSSSMEAVGLIVLTSALITIYLFWTIVSFRYHIRLFREWRRSNQNVRLLIPRPQVLLSNQPNPLLAQKSSKLQPKETIV